MSDAATIAKARDALTRYQSAYLAVADARRRGEFEAMTAASKQASAAMGEMYAALGVERVDVKAYDERRNAEDANAKR